MAGLVAEMVRFPANGEEMPGYLARPEGGGPFPGVIVVQEWWGIDEHIQDVCRRFAREGYVALAPDLYRGKVTREPNEAQKLMMSLDMPRAVKELARAADWLAAQPYTQGRGIGAIGFCMGGGLALELACTSPHIKAVAPFYGVNPQPIDKVQNIQGPVLAIYAEHDPWVDPPRRSQELREALERYGKRYEIHVYPGTQHAFFNDTRREVYNAQAAQDAWQRVLALFRDNL
ncbi:MAG TPA: dienelactone hydrolase family protein [Dehalococcoidia bacterium]|nr:dienelactone hydrolase family protein [Dehalococcoidia bacterium]